MAPIGVFDSGYGGLTVLRSLVTALPQYDYFYLGDNARTPYGNRSFETVYRYTLQSVRWLLQQGCPLIILACNTASAKALRSIQQNDLERLNPQARVLGVIRPTTEAIGDYSTTKNIGILATAGTVASHSYPIEIEKFFPELTVTQQACPMWVPLIENSEHNTDGADYFIKKYVAALLQQNKNIDVVLLACTHYPLIKDAIQKALPAGVQVLAQGDIVANSLKAYLQRHPEIQSKITQERTRTFFTTDDAAAFAKNAALFFGEAVTATHVQL